MTDFGCDLNRWALPATLDRPSRSQKSALGPTLALLRHCALGIALEFLSS